MNGGKSQEPNIQSILSQNAAHHLLDNSAQNCMGKSAASPYMDFDIPRFLHKMAAKPYMPISAAGSQFVMPSTTNSP